MNIPAKAAARAALLCILLLGCASAPGKPFSPEAPPPGKAAVYFYRPSQMTGMLQKPTIKADDAKLGRLCNDSYGVAYLTPGRAQLRSTWPGIPGAIRDDRVELEIEAGKAYFLRVRYHVGKPHAVAPKGLLAFEDRVGLEEVPQADAAPQMARMKPCEAFAPEK